MRTHIRKLAHLCHPIVWYKCRSWQMWFHVQRQAGSFCGCGKRCAYDFSLRFKSRSCGVYPAGYPFWG